jgi:hypothetical protein
MNSPTVIQPTPAPTREVSYPRTIHAQYLADLDALDRCECAGNCVSFFSCMGAIAGQRLDADLHLKDDAQLESHITHCSIQLQAAYKLGMKGEAHRWREAMEEALRERHRRPDVVARMERDRGLD